MYVPGRTNWQAVYSYSNKCQSINTRYKGLLTALCMMLVSVHAHATDRNGKLQMFELVNKTWTLRYTQHEPEKRKVDH